MNNDGPVAAMWRSVALGALLLVGGCAWWPWHRSAPVASPASAPALAAPVATAPVDAEPASAARTACANYDQVYLETPFPRDAIIRGIDAGNASVRFLVDGSTISVLSVSSSDPAFGTAAVAVVRKLECRVDRPTQFRIPFEWRTRR